MYNVLPVTSMKVFIFALISTHFERFNKEYWNYAKLISGVLRYRMPLTNVIKLISSLQLENENINTWANGVARALKKYVNGEDESADDTSTKDDSRSIE